MGRDEKKLKKFFIAIMITELLLIFMFREILPLPGRMGSINLVILVILFTISAIIIIILFKILLAVFLGLLPLIFKAFGYWEGTPLPVWKWKMMNPIHFTIITTSVTFWNSLRKRIPFLLFKPDFYNVGFHKENLQGADLHRATFQEALLVDVNLQEAKLQRANFQEAKLKDVNLQEAKLQGANFQEAKLIDMNLRGANLYGADFRGANLYGADLIGANLQEAKLQRTLLDDTLLQDANLQGADLQGATLSWAFLDDTNLQEANLQEANLIGTSFLETDLRKATITGVYLYGTARENWKIDGIICDYVFWDRPGFSNEEEKRLWEQEHRFPKDRDFRPGEFEELYKQVPTFEYVFKHGFTALDAVVMSRIVEAINEQHPEFKLKLDSFRSRGQPHAKFTVLHKENIEEALKQVATDYERRIEVLEGKQEQMMELFARIADNPKTIELILGDKRMIQTGRDYLEQIGGDAHTGGTIEESERNTSND